MNTSISIQQNSYGIEHTSKGTTLVPGLKPVVSDEEVRVQADSLSINAPGETPAALAAPGASFDMSAPAATQGITTFNSLSMTDKKVYRDTLMALNRNARLFIHDQGHLRRASAMEVRSYLDTGREVYLVTSLGGEQTGQSSFSRSESETVGMLTYHDYHFGSAASHGNEQSIYYSASPFSSWDDLAFADTDGMGVPGTACLPKSGGRAVVSSDWESRWQNDTYKKDGFFRITEQSSHKGGNESVHRR